MGNNCLLCSCLCTPLVRPYMVASGASICNVFKPCTATGSELLSFLTCLHTTTVLMLTIFSVAETLSMKARRNHCPGMQNVRFRFPFRAQIRHGLVLKLPFGNDEGGLGDVTDCSSL